MVKLRVVVRLESVGIGIGIGIGVVGPLGLGLGFVRENTTTGDITMCVGESVEGEREDE